MRSMWEYEIAFRVRLELEQAEEYTFPLPVPIGDTDDPWINPQTTAYAPPF